MSALLTFFDIEANPSTNKILDIGAVRSDGIEFHKNDLFPFLEFTKPSTFLIGHNIFRHDLKIIAKAVGQPNWGRDSAIDTLLLSPLLFPAHPYHRLLKDDHFLPEEQNNPLEDALKARDLFFNEVAAFRSLPVDFQDILCGLLGQQAEFTSFFTYLQFHRQIHGEALVSAIRTFFGRRICEESPVEVLVRNHPVELAYSLALIMASDRYSITPPWVVHTFPRVEVVLRQLRNEPCSGCSYCNKALSAVAALKRFFGYDAYRSYDGVPLQEDTVNAALHHRSLLAIFPTGGGKSVTFQVPALLSGENARALTVVISPLQSLMKDQVDNLESKGITDAVTINGLLDPIERQKVKRGLIF